jgi:hypothetical protein
MIEGKTSRGFQIVGWSDINNVSCNLQQSSLAIYEQPGTGAVWLGREVDRMHLNEDQVRELVQRLKNWLDTGSIHLPKSEQTEICPTCGKLRAYNKNFGLWFHIESGITGCPQG